MGGAGYARDCDHCGRPIVILRTVWGSERPWRAYEATETPTDQAHPLCRYAYSRRRGGVLQLDPTLAADDPTLPPRVLIPHHCGRGAAIGGPDDAVVDMVDAWLRGEAPDTGPPPRRGNLGFRRGFGKSPPP